MQSRKEQEVWQACDTLLAQGLVPKEITGERLGMQLREMGLLPGSLTYRYKYRDTWMVKRGLSRETPLANPPSDDLLDKSVAMFKQGIREELEAGFQAEREQLATAQQALEQTIAELQLQLDAKEQQVSLQQNELLNYETALEEAVTKQQQLEIEFAEMHRQNELLNQSIADARAHAAGLSSVYEQQQTKLEATLNAKVDDYKALLLERDQRLLLSADQHKVSQQKLQQQLLDKAAEHASLRTKHEHLTTNHDQLLTQCQRMVSQNQILEQQCQQQMARLQAQERLLQTYGHSVTNKLQGLNDQIEQGFGTLIQTLGEPSHAE